MIVYFSIKWDLSLFPASFLVPISIAGGFDILGVKKGTDTGKFGSLFCIILSVVCFYVFTMASGAMIHMDKAAENGECMDMLSAMDGFQDSSLYKGSYFIASYFLAIMFSIGAQSNTRPKENTQKA